jgi:dimethylargininase
MLLAITRQVSRRFASCQLEFQVRQEIDVAKARAQHRDYEQALRNLGVHVVSLPALEDQPDCVFVEDPAVVLDEVAVIAWMGSPARRGESATLAEALGAYRPLARMTEPATLDGGDVVRIGKTLYVGLSRRTNAEGCRQLAEIAGSFGYRVVPVSVTGCLHLKSACCYIGDNTVVVNRRWFHAEAFMGYRMMDVPREEPAAADVLRIGDTVLIPASFPRTQGVLERAGFRTLSIDVSELQKAEAGVTCMSLIFEAIL